MNSRLMLFKAFFLVCFYVVTASAAEQYITVGSFNVSELGSSRPNKRHGEIARLISGFDLTVIEEVQDNGGEMHVRAIVDSLNASGGAFSYFIIPSAGRGFPGNEGYAFIYRSPVHLDSLYAKPYGLKETSVTYGRLPGWAYFRAGDFDFMVVGVHLHWSNLDTRANEVADLKAWLKDFASRPATEERDLIIIGDWNRFGNYSNTAINNRQTAFHQLLDDPDLNVKYRLPFCEFLPTMDAKEAPTDSGSTTVADDNRMVYDQMAFSQGAFNEFGSQSGTLGANIGIEAFDTAPEYAGLDTETIKDLISDHRPIYTHFRIDLGDDDGFGGGGGGSEPVAHRGDVNRDGQTNIFDLLELLAILGGKVAE